MSVDNEEKNYQFAHSKSKRLYCHIMQNNKEIAKLKKRVYDQDFTWKKRIWPIDHTQFIVDVKGESHIYVDVNNMAILSFKQPPDKCKQCSKKMSIDAKNARDLVKRKTITAIWGVDSMPMLLLIIMAIVMLVMIAVVFYMYSEIRAKDVEIDKLSRPIIITPPVGN